MKKVCIIFLLSIIISLTAIGFSPAFKASEPTVYENYLRIHIRADSNESDAQAVKYLVRDKIVEYLTPLVANYETREQAMQGVSARLSSLRAVAESALARQGFDYGASVELKREVFPTRVYGEFILPAGEYYALIVDLGAGKGDNWWCVVYPPLCFTSGNGNPVYKSKILEIIRRATK